jgi:hypothetical protein
MTLDFSQFSLKGPAPQRLSKGPKVSNLRPQSVPFINGPIPLAWMKAAATLPGKCLHVGLALWYLAGLKKTKTVALGNLVLEGFGVSRKAKGNCLKELERAGLITVESRPGCSPIVTLLDAPEVVKPEGQGKPSEVNALSKGIAADDIALATRVIQSLRTRLENQGKLEPKEND